MKFIDKLFSSDDAPWKDWILRDASASNSTITGGNSYLWKIINDELSTYRSLTYVNVHNGSSTFSGSITGSLMGHSAFPTLLFLLTPPGLTSLCGVFS
jgi:hypothetical protein